jgi:hypothetical protein
MKMMIVQERCDEVIAMLQTIKDCIDERAYDEFHTTVIAGCGQESTKFVLDKAMELITEYKKLDYLTWGE